mgnify:CR=1 FL=1
MSDLATQASESEELTLEPRCFTAQGVVEPYFAFGRMHETIAKVYFIERQFLPKGTK